LILYSITLCNFILYTIKFCFFLMNVLKFKKEGLIRETKTDAKKNTRIYKHYKLNLVNNQNSNANWISTSVSKHWINKKKDLNFCLDIKKLEKHWILSFVMLLSSISKYQTFLCLNLLKVRKKYALLLLLLLRCWCCSRTVSGIDVLFSGWCSRRRRRRGG
jgi:hypothetical protein